MEQEKIPNPVTPIMRDTSKQQGSKIQCYNYVQSFSIHRQLNDILASIIVLFNLEK